MSLTPKTAGKTKPTTPPPRDYAALKTEILATLPTALELAGIASRLSNPSGKSALALWIDCQLALDGEVRQRASAELQKLRHERLREQFGQPASFPVKLKEFLRRVVPGKRECDREKRFRDYLCWAIRVSRYNENPGPGWNGIPEMTGEAGDAVKARRQSGFSEHEYYREAESFRDWHQRIFVPAARVAAGGTKKKKKKGKKTKK